MGVVVVSHEPVARMSSTAPPDELDRRHRVLAAWLAATSLPRRRRCGPIARRNLVSTAFTARPVVATRPRPLYIAHAGRPARERVGPVKVRPLLAAHERAELLHAVELAHHDELRAGGQRVVR